VKPMYRLRVALFLTIAAIFLSTACRNESVSDDKLASSIKANLSSDPTTKAANVNVAVSNGVVTITGDVPSSDVELQAMKIANGTSGVKRVDDQMKVNAALAANQPPPQSSQTQAPPASTTESQPAPASPAPASVPVSPQSPATAETPASVTEPARAPSPARTKVTIPAGEHVTIRMIDSIDSDRNEAGQEFRASLVSPLVSRGRVVVPADATVYVVLATQADAGRLKGRSALEIQLSRLEYHGRSYPLASSLYEEQGKSRGKQTAKRTGIGAVAGAVIGAIAGGGKGAAIGSAVGGGGAAGYQLFTHGQKVKIPSETVITFRLTAPVTIDRRG
jgi:BON domain